MRDFGDTAPEEVSAPGQISEVALVNLFVSSGDRFVTSFAAQVSSVLT